MSDKKLTLDKANKKIAGVCAGLANYLDIDVTGVRIVFLIACVCGFSAGFWAYVIIWAVAPSS